MQHPSSDLDDVFDSHESTERSNTHRLSELYQLFIPDYSKDASEIFTQLSQVGIQQFEDTDMLRWAGVGWSRNVRSLPSWATDWSALPHTLIEGFESYPGGYQAGGLSHVPKLAYKFLGEFIRVHGVLAVDKVDSLSSIINHDQDISSTDGILKFDRSWFNDAANMVSCAPSLYYPRTGYCRFIFNPGPDLREELLWRVLVGDMHIGSRKIIGGIPLI
jgi:hypothetical protein